MPDGINETAAIVGIYGEVDRRVQGHGNRAAREAVAELLPPYEDPKLYWFPEFEEWMREEVARRGERLEVVDGQPPFPDAPTALGALADTAPPRPRMRARRIFAIALLARAVPEMIEPDHPFRGPAIAALKVIPDKPGTEPTEDQAEDLFKVLSGESKPEPFDPKQGPAGEDPWWVQIVLEGLHTKVLPDEIGMYPRPCIAGMVRVPGVEGRVDALRTEFMNKEVEFDKAMRYLEPMNWLRCRPDFWCSMEKLREPATGLREYHEVFSTHCSEPARGGFWGETDLLVDFTLVEDQDDHLNGNAAIANYKLAKEPEKQDFIQVDEGTLVVAEVPKADGLLITSTKRIKFSREIPTGWCAVMMCALGYGDAAADLIACAACEGEDPPPFPVVRVSGAAPGGGGAPAARSRDRGGPAPDGGLVQEVADIWAQAIRDGAAALERNLGRAGRGGAPRRRGPRS